MTDPDPITIAARALVRACADSSEEFEIEWHKPAVREAAMRGARAAFEALKAAMIKLVKREPTNQMYRAADERQGTGHPHADIFTSMWDAAPDHSTSEEK